MVGKKGFVVANSEEQGDNTSFSESAIDNNHLLSNQRMPLLAVPNEIPSPLTDIFRAITFLPLETFHNSGEEKDLLGSSNTL